MIEAEPPVWADKIRRFLSAKGLSQIELANALGVSAATVSRWLSGKNEPTPQAYVALGNLADPPDDLYFWERAGVHLKDAQSSPLRRIPNSSETTVAELPALATERASHIAPGDQSVIAIPLFGICAYADEVPPHEHVSLAQAQVEEMITAPLSWCPRSDNLAAMHVCGDSMFPTMGNDALIVLDLSDNKREDLNHQLVVVSHRDLGFKVSRLQHLSDCYVLVPANPSCTPIDISDPSKWKIVGKVLWWVTRDHVSPTAAAISQPRN